LPTICDDLTLMRDASNCPVTADPHNSDFEILFATLVDGVVQLARENGQYCAKVHSHASRLSRPSQAPFILSR
jgi:hypothetical protein